MSDPGSAPTVTDGRAVPLPELSVILCTLNGSKTIADQLAALLDQDSVVDVEFVVVDNGSTDRTADVIDEFRVRDSRIRLVSAADRRNLSYARNVGVVEARAPSIAFCDDDDIVGIGWIDAMADAIESNPLVGSRLEYSMLNDPDRMVGRAKFQSERIEQMFDLPVLSGAGFGCQRWIWDAVGGNDESFGTTGEDFDFAMRVVNQTAVAPVLVPAANYHYRLRKGGRGTFRQARRFGQSHVQLYRRHAPGSIPIRRNMVEAAKVWWWIITRAPMAAVGVRRENWATQAGRRFGRLTGSIRMRTWLL